jgi:hypothetical protein
MQMCSGAGGHDALGLRLPGKPLSPQHPSSFSSACLVPTYAAFVQVAAYTNGRGAVTEYDALLLQYVLWSRPEDQERVYDWLLSRLAADGDIKQTNYLLASLFGRTCHALEVRSQVTINFTSLMCLQWRVARTCCACWLACLHFPTSHHHLGQNVSVRL